MKKHKKKIFYWLAGIVIFMLLAIVQDMVDQQSIDITLLDFKNVVQDLIFAASIYVGVSAWIVFNLFILFKLDKLNGEDN